MRSVAERLVGGSAAAAESYFLSRFNPVATRIKKSKLSGN
jgi:hypothetical protein